MKFVSYIVCLAVIVLLMMPLSAPVVAQSGELVDTTLIKSGDAQLYLEMRGPAKRSPILLYLHGGPGNPLGVVAFRAYVGPQLESRYLVCYLHQRGVLNSPAPPDASLTIANHVADVHNVVQYLRSRFRGRKIYLLGHSWGGTLAVLSILDNDGGISGVIDVSGPLNFPASQSESYRATLKWAQDTNNSEAIQELKALGAPPYHDLMQHMKLSNWSSAANGGISRHLSVTKLLSRPPFTTMESWQRTDLRAPQMMFPDLAVLNVDPQLARLKTPLLVISAKLDAIVPSSELEKSYNLYGGPKHRVELQASNHLSFLDEPEAFVKAVSDFIR